MSSLPQPRMPGFPPRRRSALANQLTGLLREMVVVRDLHGQRPDQGPDFDCWSDDAYIYVEASQPDDPAVEADVSILEGRILIRIRRPDDRDPDLDPDADLDAD